MDISLYKYYAAGIIVFVGVMSAGEYLFSRSYERLPHFAARWWLTHVAVLALSLGLEILHFYLDTVTKNIYLTNISAMFVYAVISFMIVAAMKLCYAKSWPNCIISMILAFLCQHIYYNMYAAAATMGFEREIYIATGEFPGLMICTGAQLVFAFAVLGIVYFLLSKKLKDISSIELTDKSIFVISAAAFLIVLVLNSFANIYAADTAATAVFVKLLLALCCIFVLIIYVNKVEAASAKHELDIITKLNDREYRYYNKLKENMDLIDIKCHDIKHYIAAAGSGTAIDLSELSKQVNIYDDTIKTGNEILDTLLSERSLYCAEHKISLAVMANASALGFIGKADMCALFGNIIENAIEAADKVTDKEKRTVSLNIRPIAGQISVCAENYFNEELLIKDGMPVSQKQRKGFHGFGLKSIKYITEKYGGFFSYKAEGDLFRLSILFPAKNTE